MGEAHRPAMPVPAQFAHALLVLGCLAVGAGCRQPTAPPTAAPTRSVQAGEQGSAADGGAMAFAPSTGTARPLADREHEQPSASVTADLWPSETPWTPIIPTPTPGPALLQMTLADAEATAMAWSIPDREPRIERSGYVGAVDAFGALEAAGADMELSPCCSGGLLQWRIAEGMPWAGEPPGGPLVLVEISQRGFDLVYPWNDRRDSRLDNCVLVPASERYTVTHVFDPRIEAHPGYVLESAPPALWAVASTAIDHVRITATPTSTAVPTPSPDANASPTATLTPSPTLAPLIDATSRAFPLGVGEHPAALADAVAAWPLVVGSTWTYRATEHYDGVRWSTWTITESVVSAVRHGEALMEVELARVTDRADGFGTDLWPELGRDRLLVRRDGVLYAILRSNRSLSPAQAAAELPPARSRAWGGGWAVPRRGAAARRGLRRSPGSR